jgi:hypothetical protein
MVKRSIALKSHTNKFAALEDLGAEVQINSALETMRENIEISAIDSRLI